LSNLIVFAAIIHDCGKLCVRFQGLRPDLMPHGLRRLRGVGKRHDALGTALWDQYVREALLGLTPVFLGTQIGDNHLRLLDSLVTAAVCHHGVPRFCNSATWAKETYGGDPVADRALELFEIAAKCAGLPVEAPEDAASVREGWQEASWWISGLIVLADWIGSSRDYFPYFDEPIDARTYWDEKALPQSAKALATAGVLAGKFAPVHHLQQLFPDLVGKARPLQERAEELPLTGKPECLILEDVPGTGKTEAALLLAARLLYSGQGEGIYFALPTMATANAMYGRLEASYRCLFGGADVPSLSLAHGASRLNEGFVHSVTDVSTDDSGASCTRWLADSNKRALLAPVAVGTIDQALLAVLPNRHQNLRLSALADKILIVDEVHACDDYVLSLLHTLLARHATDGGSAILLSATLPQKTRQDLVRAWCEGASGGEAPILENTAYPLLTQCSSEGYREIPTDCPEEFRRKLPVSLIASQDTIVDALLEEATEGGCAAWIRNTVRDAIEAYEALRKRLPLDRPPILFHARFALGDRLEREKEVLEAFGRQSGAAERSGRVLVATQVVEQSLDLDFDLLASDLAPIDLLIQRAGRCHRHRRDVHGNVSDREQRRPGRLLLLTPDPDDLEAFSEFLKGEGRGLAAVYPHHHHLWRGARLLKARGHMAVPDEARSLVEAVYDENIAEPTPESLQRAADQAAGGDAAMRCLASNNTVRFRSGYSPKSAPAWGDDEYTPTRLGEPTTRLRLARWDAGALRPWSQNESNAWELSEVAVRSVLCGEAIVHDDALRNACEAHIQERGGRLHGRRLLPLILDKNTDRWQSPVSASDGTPRLFTYDVNKGLMWD
jgi:CRISPR-associated endonuclease/helicase Cas3